HLIVASSLGPDTPYYTPDAVLARECARRGLESVATGDASGGTYFLARRTGEEVLRAHAERVEPLPSRFAATTTTRRRVTTARSSSSSASSSATGAAGSAHRRRATCWRSPSGQGATCAIIRTACG